MLKDPLGKCFQTKGSNPWWRIPTKGFRESMTFERGPMDFAWEGYSFSEVVKQGVLRWGGAKI